MKQVDISGAFSFAFQTLKKYPMLLLGPPIFFSFLSNLINLFTRKLTPTNIEAYKNKFLEIAPKNVPPYLIVILIFLLLLIITVAIILGITLEIGRIRIAIHAFNKSEQDLSWNVYNNFGTGIIGRYFLTSLLLVLLVLVGSVFLIIPGIILSYVFLFALFVLVDKRVSISDSLKISNKLSNGIKWSLFGYGLLVVCIYLPIHHDSNSYT